MYGLLKAHLGLLRLMFDRCGQIQISLNLNKCIFYVSFGSLLGHFVCKEAVLVDPAKITVVVNLPSLMNVRQLRSTLGNMGYYVISP